MLIYFRLHYTISNFYTGYKLIRLILFCIWYRNIFYMLGDDDHNFASKTHDKFSPRHAFQQSLKLERIA